MFYLCFCFIFVFFLFSLKKVQNFRVKEALRLRKNMGFFFFFYYLCSFFKSRFCEDFNDAQLSLIDSQIFYFSEFGKSFSLSLLSFPRLNFSETSHCFRSSLLPPPNLFGFFIYKFSTLLSHF